MSALTDFLKTEQFTATVQVLLYPNTGGWYMGGQLIWDGPIDITEYLAQDCLNSLSAAEGIIDTSQGSGGQMVDQLNMVFDNTTGVFDEVGPLFAGNILNNSKVVITSSYKTFTKDSLGVLVPTVIASYVFTGLIKSLVSSYSVTYRKFNAGVVSAGNVLVSAKAKNALTGSTLKDALVYYLQNPDGGELFLPRLIISMMYITPVNITFGVSDAITYNQDTADEGIDILDLINQCCFATNSIWRIAQNGDFIIEPINNTGASVWDLTPDDIISVDDISAFPLQYTELYWNDGDPSLALLCWAAMAADERGGFGYDLITKTITLKWLDADVSVTYRQSLLDQVFAQVKHKHRQITITTKCNTELYPNQIITIDHPQQAGKNTMVIDPSIKWRVLTVRRNINLAPCMQIIAVQAGTGPDANLDGT